MSSFLPPPERLAFYGGLGVLAAVGVLEWPVAVAVGAGTVVAQRARRADEGAAGPPPPQPTQPPVPETAETPAQPPTKATGRAARAQKRERPAAKKAPTRQR